MSPASGWQQLVILGQEAQSSLLRRAGGEEGEGEIPRAKRVGLERKGQSCCGGGGLGSRAGKQWGLQDLGRQGQRFCCVAFFAKHL